MPIRVKVSKITVRIYVKKVIQMIYVWYEQKNPGNVRTYSPQTHAGWSLIIMSFDLDLSNFELTSHTYLLPGIRPR